MKQYRVIFKRPNGDTDNDYVVYDSLEELHRFWIINNVTTFVQERYVSDWSDLEADWVIVE